MEFEQLILEALQTKYTGVDAKILSRIAKKHAKTDTGTTEADAKTIVDGIAFQQVLESYADYRATEAQKTAIANYENKHNLRDGKPIEQQEQNQTAQQGGQQTEDQIPEWAQKMLADNKAMREEIQTYKAERIRNTRLERFREAIKAAPNKIKERYEKDFSRLSFKDDADFDSYIEEITPDITAMAAQASRNGASVGAPFGSQGSGTAANSLVKARFEAAAKADAAPAIAGLPTTNP